VELSVPAAALGQLAEGMAAQVRATAFEARGEARLSHIGALVGEHSRSATARLVLANPKGLWRPGLPVTVALKAAEADVPVAVTADAVQTLDGRSVVFVRQGQQFEARTVELGRRDEHHVEVQKGLAAGERYAARNSFLVKADIGKAAAEHTH
jgi:cobalt-zinc-cadmium efflux system membrane fusion protein